nr:hypothetical protein Iba_chr15cCG3730 [Ipomoea batatas]GME15835.1 hypothetical protein Iba_scaffold16807CG0020 [Ipomoea batatas]
MRRTRAVLVLKSRALEYGHHGQPLWGKQLCVRGDAGSAAVDGDTGESRKSPSYSVASSFKSRMFDRTPQREYREKKRNKMRKLRCRSATEGE